jgi:HSP20 family molecular chaperone IbpA
MSFHNFESMIHLGANALTSVLDQTTQINRDASIYETNRSHNIKTNIKESEEYIDILIFMPGVSKENVKMDIETNKIIISGLAHLESTVFTDLSYKINLCSRFELKSDIIKAIMNNGILKINIKKTIKNESIPVQ